MVDLDTLLCNERWRCYKKRRVHSLISYWAEKFFLLPVSPLVWFGICCICNKKQKLKKKQKTTKYSWATVQYWDFFVSFSKRYSMGCSRSRAPMRLFSVYFWEGFRKGGGLPQRVTHLSNLKTETFKTCTSRANAEVGQRCEVRESLNLVI